MKDLQREIIKQYVNSYNSFDIDGMVTSLSKDFIFENISNDKVDLRTEGLVAFIEQAESAKQYFSERKQSINSWEFSDAKITIGIDYKAVVAIDLPNGLKRGDTLELKGKSVFVFQEKKIVEIRDVS